MRLKRKKQKPCKAVSGALSIVMLLGLLVPLMTFAGCAGFKRPLIHPLPQDFILAKQGDTITFPKQGAYVSDYFMCRVMGIDVEGLSCKDVK